LFASQCVASSRCSRVDSEPPSAVAIVIGTGQLGGHLTALKFARVRSLPGGSPRLLGAGISTDCLPRRTRGLRSGGLGPGGRRRVALALLGRHVADKEPPLGDLPANVLQLVLALPVPEVLERHRPSP
jgi:hypothetical protein